MAGLFAAAAQTFALNVSASEAGGSVAAGTAGAVAQEPVKPRFHDKVTAFFAAWKAFGQEYIGPILLSDFMFYTAIFLVVQWHFRFHCSEWVYSKCCRHKFFTRRQVKPMMTPRRVGLNILILGFFYDSDLPGSLDSMVKRRPFFCAIMLVFLDTVVVYYVFMFIGSFVNPEKFDPNSWTNPLDETEDDGVCPDKMEATNIYEDLTYKFQKVCPMFLAQMGLVLFYIKELNSSEDLKDLKNVDFNYWLVAVMFQMYGGDAQVGEAFNRKYWRYVLKGKSCMEHAQHMAEKKNLRAALLEAQGMYENCCGRPPCLPSQHPREPAEPPDPVERKEAVTSSFKELGREWHKVFWICEVKYSWEWQIRRTMDFVVNSVARGIILYTVPIMVCVEGPLDFVKDLTAVMFITMLDNIDGQPKELEEILVRLKFAVFSNRMPKLRQIINWVTGQDARPPDVGPSGPPLSRLERDYIEGKSDKFERIRSLAADRWKEFIRTEHTISDMLGQFVGAGTGHENR